MPLYSLVCLLIVEGKGRVEPPVSLSRASTRKADTDAGTVFPAVEKKSATAAKSPKNQQPSTDPVCASTRKADTDAGTVFPVRKAT